MGRGELASEVLERGEEEFGADGRLFQTESMIQLTLLFIRIFYIFIVLTYALTDTLCYMIRYIRIYLIRSRGRRIWKEAPILRCVAANSWPSDDNSRTWCPPPQRMRFIRKFSEKSLDAMTASWLNSLASSLAACAARASISFRRRTRRTSARSCAGWTCSKTSSIGSIHT